jgi:DNA-binding CsgD family transcriptional regulator
MAEMPVRATPRLAGMLQGEGTGPVPVALSDLLALSSWLAVRWNEFDEAARLALVGQIQRVASQIGRRVQPSGGPLTTPDEPVVFHRLFLLTPRELEVLGAMADGHSTARIASVLGIGISTVRSHVKSLLAKLGLHSRVEAVSMVLRHEGGLVTAGS